MRRSVVFVGCLAVFSSYAGGETGANEPPAPPPFEDVVAGIASHSPRLFLNDEQVAKIRQNLTSGRKDFLDRLREEVEGDPEAPAIDTERIAEGDWLRFRNTDWGAPAMNAALLYLMTDEPEYLDRAAALLEAAVESYRLRYQSDRPISWYAWSRLSALAAFDWIQSDLPEARKESLGQALFQHIVETQKLDELPPREGTNRPTAGFYGVAVLPWYAGLVFHGAGIDDEQALTWLKTGYEDHLEMFQHRARMAGESGGSTTVTYGYAAGEYHHAEDNFFLSWKSALGEEFAPYFPDLGLFPNWLMWNLIPGLEPGEFHEFGIGDSWHRDKNRVRLPRFYLAEYRYFYRDMFPDMTLLVENMLREGGEFDAFRTYLNRGANLAFIPLLLDIPARGVRDMDTESVERIRAGLPRAQHFPQLGQFVMSSGWGPRDTYATFIAGAEFDSHKHRDENHFVIYREGYLALDSGTRGGASLFQHFDGLRAHQDRYFKQTIAHNAVLIAPAKGDSSEIDPDGGMGELFGAEVLACEVDDAYVYIASDAARAYHPEQAEEVLRQFVFVVPDFFVVFDRIRSPRPEQRKAWLFHTQNEPAVVDDVFEVDHWEGHLFGRTVYPPRARIEKVGGPAREFESGGKNFDFDVPERFESLYHEDLTLFGNWRLEVRPPDDEAEQVFLHLLQVGGSGRLDTMTESHLLREPNTIGVAFDGPTDTRVEIRFKKAGEPGGSIRIVDGERVILDRSFTGAVGDAPLDPHE